MARVGDHRPADQTDGLGAGFRKLRRFGFGRLQLRRDLDDEIRHHLETTTRELIEAGMEPGAARAEARRRFGDLERHRRACRRIDRRRYRLLRREELMSDLTMDLRFAWRNFRRSPGFVLVAVLTLAIGMAANAVVYSMVYSLLLKPLPYGEPGRLMAVWDTVPARGVDRNAISAPNFADWREMNQVFTDMAAHTPKDMNLTGLDRPERLQGYRVTANVFDVLGVEPAIGRSFSPEDDEPGATPVVVLSDRVWQNRFGGDPSLVGNTIRLDDAEHTVIGIMPPRFEYPQFQFRGDVWVPLRLPPGLWSEPRGWRYLVAVGRLRDGVTVAQAQQEMNRVSERLEADYPEANADRRTSVEPLQELVGGPLRPAVAVLLATVGFVLLICCANIANLFLARGSARHSELAVRSALGASRFRVVRQLLTEGLVIAVFGGLVGFGLSRVLLGALEASLPTFVQRVAPTSMEQGVDWRVFLVTMAVSSATALVFALWPAMRASRVDLQDSLRGAAPGSGTGGRARTRGLLVVAEVAMSVVLVVGAGLMVKGFVGMLRTDTGFDAEGAVTFPLVLPEARYETAAAQREFFSRVQERVEAVPGVAAAGASSIIPLAFSDNSSSFEIDGQPVDEPGTRPVARRRNVTARFFAAMGMEIVRGREIARFDDENAAPVVVVNEAFVRAHFADEEPIGQRLRLSGDGTWWEIVGVVVDVRQDVLDYANARPTFYFPFAQLPEERMTLVVRVAEGNPAALAGPVGEAVWSVDPDMPLGEVQTLAEIVDGALFIYRLPTQLMAAFALAALLLAAIGLYGVMSYLVARRGHEIGVRMALGAESRRVVGLVVRRGLTLAVAGIVVGSVLAYGVGQVLGAILENVSGSELSVYLGVPVLLLIVTVLASWVPARRASRVDPLEALRSE